MFGSRNHRHQKEDIPDLPEPGESSTSYVYTKKEKGIWSLVKTPGPDVTTHHAVWRYPTVGLWKKINRSGQDEQREERIWRYALLETSLVSGLTLEKDHISNSSYQQIMRFSPALIPSALVREFSNSISLSTSESLRIERECFSIWASSSGSGLRDPHPILADVIWSMSLHEKFGIQSWPPLDQMHVRVYSVIRKALECYSQAQDLNSQAAISRARAQKLSGVGPGAAYGR